MSKYVCGHDHYEKLEQQNAKMLAMLKSIKELTIDQKRMSEERVKMELHNLGSDLDELIKKVEGEK